MTGEEVGKREGMAAFFELGWFRQELPFVEFSVFCCAVGAVFVDWLFERYSSDEVHFEGLKCDFWIGNCEEELSGQEGTGRLLWAAVEDERR